MKKWKDIFKKKNNIVDISYVTKIFESTEPFITSDTEALKSDWNQVGDDIRWGIKQIKA